MYRQYKTFNIKFLIQTKATHIYIIFHKRGQIMRKTRQFLGIHIYIYIYAQFNLMIKTNRIIPKNKYIKSRILSV